MSWFDQGYDGAKEQAEKKELGFPPNRFWLKADASKKVVFIDDAPFCIWEHSFKDYENQKNFVTCISKFSEEGCPGCYNPTRVGKGSYTGFLTVVDLTGYTTRDGEERGKYELMFLAPKTMLLNKLRKRKENKGSLVGCIFNFSRSADKQAAATGDDLEFDRDAKLDMLYTVVTYRGKNISETIAAANGGDAKANKFLRHHFQLDDGPIPAKIPVFNYANHLKPMDAKDMRAFTNGAQALGYTDAPLAPKRGAQGTATGATSDDTPF